MVKKLFQNLLSFIKSFIFIICILISIFIVDFIVYISGGTSFAFTHMMYIPIVISASVFGAKGSVLVAILAGMSLGPFMPLNVKSGIMQGTEGWVIRTIFFIGIGIVVGLLVQSIRDKDEREKKKAYENIITGMPNVSKFYQDLHEIIKKNKQNIFSIIVFKFENIDEINRYVNYETGKRALLKLIDIINELFTGNSIYSIYTNEVAIIMPKCNTNAAYIKGLELLEKLKKPIFIDGLPVYINIKGGALNYPLHGTNEYDLSKNLGRALHQGEKTNIDISIYDSKIADEISANYNTLVTLYQAIEKDMFTLVYQPKISLLDNKVVGVEALLRLNNRENNNIEKLIKIAEDAGIISEITKWVIKNAIGQFKIWDGQGIKTKIAINLSSKDLRDNSVIEYASNLLKLNKIDYEMLEIELTERTIIENEKTLFSLLSGIKNHGIKISLDDYGTGYNSLKTLVKFPFDYVKIDKCFIDNINDKQNMIFIGNIINAIHSLEIKVIAEGVETAQQVSLLKEMGCDIIQGYYYSRPLPPDKLKDFIKCQALDA